MADEIKNKINAKLEHSEVISHEETSKGVHSLEMKVGAGGLPAKELAYLTGKNGQPSPLRFHEQGRVISRDFIRRLDLDLLSTSSSVTTDKPESLYRRAIEAYHSKGFYGTIVDILTNFAAKGFKNDVDDPAIQLFYDTWGRDIGFQETVEKILFDFFRVGLVRTFKAVGKFEPKLRPEDFDNVINKKAQANNFNTNENLKRLMAYQEIAAAKKIWSKSFVPLKYTVLNPTLIEIKGSLLFDQTETYLKPEAFQEIEQMLRNIGKLTAEQKKFLALLPTELKENIKKKKPIKLPPELVGKCDYRRQDYERYPMPRGARAFDDLVYKDELRKADFSTLDGITNYILKITIGNDSHPVMNQEDLETVARLFDTSSKSFDVVWNHTLNIEKITFPEISDILGQDKFFQVNDDLSQTMGVTRALLDGEVQGNARAIEASTKAFTEEINYARRCVKRWIEKEYEEVALAMGFSHYPNVRFDDLALKDEITMMSVVQGMIDRRIISYESGIEKLGFDFATELANMTQEQPLVQSGRLGIVGSPYNPKALPPEVPPVDRDTTPGGKDTVITQQDLQDFQKNMENLIITHIQEKQRTPEGTPSEGRPRGRPAKTPSKSVKPNTKPRKPSSTKQGRKKGR